METRKRTPWGCKALMCLLLCLAFALAGCPPQQPDVVGVMYHHWWTPGRWSDSPPNHPYEPVLGHYSNDDPAVIAQHIEWAKAHGINTFVLNYWITDRDQWWCEPNTNAVVDLCESMGMNYFFLIDGWFEFSDSRDQAFEIAWRVNARVAPYFSRPGHLKAEGKPVVFFWAAYPTDCSLWYAVRSGIEGTSGPIYMTGDKWDCFDLRMLYNPYTAASASYQTQLDRQKDLWTDRWQKSEPWAPTALPGYDDHQVRPEAQNPIVPLDPDFFRESIRTALSLPQHHPDGSAWLFVCSWSEWHEGSQIEPATNFADPLVLLKVLGEEVK